MQNKTNEKRIKIEEEVREEKLKKLEKLSLAALVRS